MELKSPRYNPYSSLQNKLDSLEENGYQERFTLMDDALQDSKGNKYQADQLAINEIHRFLNKENESEKTVVYAISTLDGIKGTLVDNYGEDSSEDITNFLQNVESKDPLQP